MDLIDMTLLCTVFGTFILLSFRLGYMCNKGNPVTKEETPKIEKKRAKKEIEEADKEFKNLITGINNIENYNGTSEGQVQIK